MKITNKLLIAFIDDLEIFNEKDEALFFVQKFDKEEIWNQYIKRTDVSGKEISVIARKIDCWETWEVALKVPDFCEYIKNLFPRKLFIYMKGIANPNICSYVKENRDDFKEYLLNELPAIEAINYLKKNNHLCPIFDIISSRKDLK
ncbi:MAG: hypothetical protein WCX46_02090 [Candidatus Paceibacterota bacterium]